MLTGDEVVRNGAHGPDQGVIEPAGGRVEQSIEASRALADCHYPQYNGSGS